MIDWVHTLQCLARDGTAAVVVTVAASRGSAPREPGAKMIVTMADVVGTIGGGHLEHKAITIARDLLASGAHGALHRFALGASLGQCCGGVVNLLFEPVLGTAPWIDALAMLQHDRIPCVRVSTAHGDAAAGHLIVTAERTIGSLGGALDDEARNLARSLLANEDGPRMREFGVATAPTLLYFEPLRAPDFEIVLFGAGHVGKALVRVLSGLPCHLTWVDSRDDQFPRDVPGYVTIACTDTPEAEVESARPGSSFLVMTHSHALDQDLAERILRRGDFAYFGLIGSISKRRQFEKRMAIRGVPPARFESMTCPIGVSGIDRKEPAAIAIAVAAELLQLRERRVATTTVATPAAMQRA